jgi:molecular chaperone DnaK (HSP70)
MGWKIGIDLGTTNSVVAFTENGKQRCVKVEENAYSDAIFPSCVGVTPTGEIVIGARARAAATHAREFKRGIGKGTVHALGDKALSSIELSTLVLRSIREGFEKKVGPVEGAVITVPANYTDAQRREVREAGALAGIDVLRIINEPSAAAIAYSLSDRPPHGKTVVVDWGGGTLDVSIVDLDSDVLDILANDGDAECGGKDVDAALVKWLVEKHAADLAPVVLQKGVVSELELEAERLKIELSGRDIVEDTIKIKAAKLFLDVKVTREEFEKLAQPWVDRVMAAVMRTLAKVPQGALGPADIDDIILVGGSCRLPLLRRAVKKAFGREGRCDLNPMEVVALGAAYQAENSKSTGRVVVLHSLVHSLGIKCRGIDASGIRRTNLFSPILATGTKIPARETKEYFTTDDDQTEVEIAVYEGDGETISGLKLWDKKNFRGLPTGKAGSFPIEITFHYDIEQILTVGVAIPGTEFRESWVPSHQKHLNDAREGSRRAIDDLLGDSMSPFKKFVEVVEAALPPEGGVLSRMHLAALKQKIAEKDVEAAERAQADLVNALSFDGIRY